MTPLELARRIERVNALALTVHSETAAGMFPDVGATTISVAGGVACFIGVDSPLSYAVGLGFDGPVTKDDIAHVIEFYETRGAVPRVDVCPMADLSLVTSLREQGFQTHSFMNVLSRSLEPLDIIAPPPDGIRVRPAAESEAELWSRTADEGFSDGAPLTERGRRLGLILFHRPEVRAYFAEIQGEIAGAASLFIHDGYAALVSASAKPDFRRRGIHTALIRTRLRLAHDLGCDVAGLFAMPGSGSQRNAERHGFRVAYTKSVMKKG